MHRIMALSADLDRLPSCARQAEKLPLLTRMRELERIVVAKRDEIARLEGLTGRRALKQSEIESATHLPPGPLGSRFKGNENFVLQDRRFARM